MTLEHIPRASEFIADLGRSLQHVPESIVFFQVPNASKILRDLAFWDVYYEHCSYFTPESLLRLFNDSGFGVVDVGFEYDNQYITIEAGSGGRNGSHMQELESLFRLEQAVLSFAETCPGEDPSLARPAPAI